MSIVTTSENKNESGRTFLWEEQLVDDNVVCVNLIRSQLLYEPLRLVQGQEFGYADADKRCLFLESSPCYP